ncbi:MAG TPA: hypothetical protein VGL77_06395 [Armatimonadota bacterium]
MFVLTRIFALLTIFLLFSCAVCRTEEAVVAPTTATDASASLSQAVDTPAAPSAALATPQKHILFGDFSITADELNIQGNNAALAKLIAKGKVEMVYPFQSPKMRKQVRLTFDAASLEIQEDNSIAADQTVTSALGGHTAFIRDAVLTTCNKPLGSHHYDMRARTFTLFADQRFEARHVSLMVGGLQLLTIPRLRGDLSSDDQTVTGPGISLGFNKMDGTYLGSQYLMALDSKDDLTINGRLGTEKYVRAGMEISRPFTLPNSFAHGTLSLVATLHEAVQNRLVSTDTLADDRLRHLTINRLPALQLKVDKIPLSGNPAQRFVLSVGSGVGRYHEDPTDVTKMRAQLWGIVSTPHYALGSHWLLHGEVGLRGAFYGNETHRATVGLISVETPLDAKIYGNVSFLRRREAGSSPFLFDRVLIPDELYTEVEFPLSRRGPWHLDLANRQDLTVGKSRNLLVTAIYAGDCLSYGLTYDTAHNGIGLEMIINGFGSFRHGASGIAFTQ